MRLRSCARYRESVKLPRRWTRVAAPLVLALGLASFLLPWLTVTADRRRAEATGIELVTRNAEYTGEYVHDAWRGEVEGVVGDSELWALPAFVAVAVALAFVLIPLRATWLASLAASAVALVLLFLWVQASSSAFRPPVSDRHWGAWLALTFVALAAVPIAVRLFEPAGDPVLRRAPERLGGRRDPTRS